MTTNYTPSQMPNPKSFYEFARLNDQDKATELMNNGLLLDKDLEKEHDVNLYYLNGFFVEETISKKQNRVVDIIPYKHGYRLETYSNNNLTNNSTRPNPLF